MTKIASELCDLMKDSVVLTGTEVDMSVLQELTSCLIRFYSLNIQNYKIKYWEQGNDVPLPINNNSNLTTTDVAIFADHLLKAINLEIFELQMWRSMTIS